MRKPFPSFSRLVLLLVPPAALIAQTDHTNAFTGNLEAECGDIQIQWGAAPQSATVMQNA